jgi:hypothetical protein
MGIWDCGGEPCAPVLLPLTRSAATPAPASRGFLGRAMAYLVTCFVEGVVAYGLAMHPNLVDPQDSEGSCAEGRAQLRRGERREVEPSRYPAGEVVELTTAKLDALDQRALKQIDLHHRPFEGAARERDPLW